MCRIWATPKELGGNNGRSGPGRAYPPNKRYPEGCSVGFDAYCLGDPIVDELASSDTARWVNTRWLQVAKQPPGTLRSWLAGRLSGESAESTYLTESYVVPMTPYDRVAPAEECRGFSAKEPEQTELQPLVVSDENGEVVQQLTATSRHAPNMGFAIWYPSDQPFVNAGAVDQIFNPSGTVGDNPGRTDVTGTKSVLWPYTVTTQRLLEADAAGLVVVLATACYAPNIPADPATSTTATYRITASGEPPALADPIDVDDEQRQQLARAACRADK